MLNLVLINNIGFNDIDFNDILYPNKELSCACRDEYMACLKRLRQFQTLLQLNYGKSTDESWVKGYALLNKSMVPLKCYTVIKHFLRIMSIEM